MSLYRVLCPNWTFCSLMVICIIFSTKVASSPLQIPTLPSNDVVFVPVVIHLVHNPSFSPFSKKDLESRIPAQIQQLNEDFCMLNENFYDTDLLPKKLRKQMGSARIQFYLAPEQPDGTPSSDLATGSQLEGVTYTQTTSKKFHPGEGTYLFQDLKQGLNGHAAWDTKRYLNIWVAKLEAYSGLAQYPWQYHQREEGKSYDGVVVDMQAFGIDSVSRGARAGGRTLTHEIGHWLGLLHTFHVSRSGEDDLVSDTPIPQHGQSNGYVTWASAPLAQIRTEKGVEVGKAYFMNFMDYTWDYCRNSFTNDQVFRMRSVFANYQTSNTFTPEALTGSRSYFQFPTIQAQKDQALVCQNTTRSFYISNIPSNFVSWEVSKELTIVGASKSTNKIQVTVESGLGSGSGEVTAIIQNPHGCGIKKMVIPVEVFSPRIVGPEDPEGKPNQYVLDAESRIHISQYKWSTSPGMELKGSAKALSAQVQVAPNTKSVPFLQIIQLNIDTDCAGKLTLAKEAAVDLERAMPFTLAPNPAKDYLAISWTSVEMKPSQSYRVRLNNLNGNTVYLGSGRGSDFRLETGRFSRGMYQLVVTQGKDRYTQRVMLD